MDHKKAEAKKLIDDFAPTPQEIVLDEMYELATDMHHKTNC